MKLLLISSFVFLVSCSGSYKVHGLNSRGQLHFHGDKLSDKKVDFKKSRTTMIGTEAKLTMPYIFERESGKFKRIKVKSYYGLTDIFESIIPLLTTKTFHFTAEEF